jgi:hypothetical protein
MEKNDMGWNTGSSLFDEIIIAANDAELSSDQKRILYERLIPAFENLDADTLDECLGEDEVFDEVLKELNPELFEDEWLDEDDVDLEE